MDKKQFRNWIELELYLCDATSQRLVVLTEVYEILYGHKPNLSEIKLDKQVKYVQPAYETNWDEIIEKFKSGELKIKEWNFCTHSEGDGIFSAYIMGEGAEQCLSIKKGFASEEELDKFYQSLGVKRILRGVG